MKLPFANNSEFKKPWTNINNTFLCPVSRKSNTTASAIPFIPSGVSGSRSIDTHRFTTPSRQNVLDRLTGETISSAQKKSIKAF